MSSTGSIVSPAAPARVESEVSLLRLYVLRAVYLFMIVGGGVEFLPPLISHEGTARGVIPSMLGGLWVLACFGLRYPLQMLPVFLFELLWKTIWLLDYGLPQRTAGVSTAQFADDFKSIAFAPVLFIAVIPWGYVWRHYVKKPADRWR